MAMLAANTIYLLIDSIDVKSFFTEVQLEASNSTVETTAGSGTTHVERSAGLDDTSWSITLGYEVSSLSTYVQKIKQGATYTIEYGPESNVSGKPRHVQSVVIESVSFTVSVNKDFVTFDISAVGADAPSVDMFAGGVYS